MYRIILAILVAASTAAALACCIPGVDQPPAVQKNPVAKASGKTSKTPAAKTPAIAGADAKAEAALKADDERRRKAEKEAEIARKDAEAKAETKRIAEEDAKGVIEAANAKLSRANYNMIRAIQKGLTIHIFLGHLWMTLRRYLVQANRRYGT
jgi:F0F1-type ATP synthase assembly protein I